MRTRHKTPTLFSVWMLDVFCCALGCVILLWILQSLSAGIQADRMKDALTDLDKTRQSLMSTEEQLSSKKAALDDKERALNSLQKDLTDTQAQLTAAKAALEKANTSLTSTRAQLNTTSRALDAAIEKSKEEATEAALAVSELTELLKKRQKQADQLEVDVAAARKEYADLATLKRQLEKQLALAEAEQALSDKQLNDLDARYQAAAKDAKEASTARAAAAAAEKSTKDLQAELSKARTQIIDLQGEKKAVDDKFSRLKADADSRFAGIAMTGRNVAIVVDVSGSMKLRDEKSPDANKWPGVIETVSKVMRSLPDLEKFQVIVFSKDAKYLLGTGEWQTYDGERSVRKVTDALTDTIPGGDTNLYSGLDLAFRLRDSGLDTVYLFSDGLPTSGPGLTDQDRRTLNDVQQTETLAKHLRGTLKNAWNIPVDGKRVRINAIGFFYESPDVGAFLWALARENDGSFVGMSRP